MTRINTQSFLVAGADLINYIPQRPPMVMIDKLIEVLPKQAISAFTILEENVFCEQGFLQAPGLTENIAQTAAAHLGYSFAREDKKTPLGFIASIKDLEIVALPAIGNEITTTITIEHELMNFTLIQGVSLLGDKVLAKCQMKIFRPEEEGL